MVLHHTPAPGQVLADVAARLAPNGVVLVTDLCSHDQGWGAKTAATCGWVFDPQALGQWAGCGPGGYRQCLPGAAQWFSDTGAPVRPHLTHLTPEILPASKEASMSEYAIFTSESVSEGHPDKMADQISDAILDAILKDDRNARVAVETMVKTGMAIVAGEVTTSTYVDLENVVREVILDIGYNSSDVGFDGASCAVLNAIGKQSPDIAMGVNESEITSRARATRA